MPFVFSRVRGQYALLHEEMKQPVEQHAQKGAQGNGEYPGPEEVDGNTPAYCTDPLYRTHTHNGAGNGMGGTYGDSQQNGKE